MPCDYLKWINGECSICNALLMLLSVAYIILVSQFHVHFLAQTLDYLQLLIIVRLKAVVILQGFLQTWFRSNFKILHYASKKLEKKTLLCNCPMEASIFCISYCTHIYCRQSILGSGNTRDNSIYNCNISVYGFHLMCSLVFLCWALSPRRLWSGENCLCLLQHTSKRALLRKGKSWESLLIAYPSCITAFWTEPYSENYTVQCKYGQHTDTDNAICH